MDQTSSSLQPFLEVVDSLIASLPPFDLNLGRNLVLVQISGLAWNHHEVLEFIPGSSLDLFSPEPYGSDPFSSNLGCSFLLLLNGSLSLLMIQLNHE